MKPVFVLLCLALIAASFISLAVAAKSVESVITQLKLK